MNGSRGLAPSNCGAPAVLRRAADADRAARRGSGRDRASRRPAGRRCNARIGRLATESGRRRDCASRDADSCLANAREAGAAATSWFGAIDERDRRTVLTRSAPSSCDRLQTEGWSDELTARIDTRCDSQNTLRAARSPDGWRSSARPYPARDRRARRLASRPAAEYRELHRRVAQDDLPRFEREFKDYLNHQHDPRHRGVLRPAEQAGGAIIRNASRPSTIRCTAIDYNPGRYIRLEPDADPEHRDPRVPQRPAGVHRRRRRRPTTATSTPSRSSSRSRRIVDRFRGREGSTELDRALDPPGHRRPQLVRVLRVRAMARATTPSTRTTPTRAASPVVRRRSWPTRSSPRRWPTSSGCDWGAARSQDLPLRGHRRGVRPRIGRVDAVRAASCSRELGLQLLIVTPLQKIHVIEPYVHAVGFVDNLTGDYSRLQGLTITEYRDQRTARLAGDQVD